MALRQLVKRLDGIMADQAKRATVGLHRKVGEPAEDTVKQIEAHAAQAGFGPRATGRADDFGAGAPRGDELGDDLGWILEVGIHRHDRVRLACIREACGQCGLKTKVA